MKELVSIIVPILNPEINPTEERMLHHCLTTLHQYPLIFITYQGADLSIVREHNQDIDIIHFPKEYFQSRQTLSKLFLMEDFYDRFNWCEFLLMHELNSWIVRDELYYWCKQGYDYIKAAPVGPDTFGAFTRLSGLKEDQKQLFGTRYDDNGLYLCRIEHMTKTLKIKRRIAHEYRHKESFSNADSLFWDLEANRFWPNLRKPTNIVRNHFAQNVINYNADKPLPFALTGISRANIEQLLFFQNDTGS